uniref:DNA-repair protein Xrcc1 N-terminal domain-containing protein n=1 Tax=Clytia hemisphaerica TaxID=252671 RepID=A0A7M5VCU5_9CNID
MSQVKFVEILRFNSEDPNYPSKNLLKSGKWLCDRNNPHQSAEVEISFSRATTIHFIDIGNSGSCYVDILVRHSLKGNDFKSLIPTFTFMSVPESKSGENKCKVEMFKQDRMMADVRDEKWDVLKIVCRQPYKPNAQYGISFVNVRGCSSGTNQAKDVKAKPPQPSNQSALNSFFGFNNTGLVSPKPGKTLALKSKSPILKSPHQVMLTKTKVTNEIQESPTKYLSEKLKFLNDAEEFLYRAGFDEAIKLGKPILMAEYREMIEKERGQKLSRQQKKLLVYIATEMKKTLQAEKNNAKISSTPPNMNSLERKCTKCEVSFSIEVMEIHEQICTATPRTKPRQNRKSICFDYTMSDEDQSIQSFNKRTPSMSAKLTSAGETSASSASSSPESRWYDKTIPKSSGSNITTTPKSFGSNTTITLKSSSKLFARKRSGSTSKAAKAKLPEPVNLPIINTHASKTSSLSSTKTGRDSPISKKLFLDHNQNENVKSNNNSDNFFDDMNLSDFEDDTTNNDDDLVVTKDTNFKRDNFQNSISINDDDDDIIISKEKNNSHNTQYVECPMCFELMSTTIIELHASTCNGKTETTPQTFNNKPSSNAFAATPYLSSVNRQANKMGSNASTVSPNLSTTNGSLENHQHQGDTQECPVCNKQINKYKIAVHVVLCTGKGLDNDKEDDDLPSIFNRKSSSTSATKTKTSKKSSSTNASPSPSGAHNNVMSVMHKPSGSHDAMNTFQNTNNTGASYNPSGAHNTPTNSILVPDHDYGKREEASCPICSITLDKSMIEVHVNMCLDRLQ